jgi:hypothetical protein
MKQISQVAERLSSQSVKGYYNPYELMKFPESVDRQNWFTSPELISLFATPEYEKLTEEQKQNLSFFEAVNFFSLNIHGEKALLEGLTQRLYDEQPAPVTNYIHHFVDEENKHMYYFGTFCQKYAGKIYPDRKFHFPREYAEGEEEFLFYVKVFIFEEIVDFYNVTTAKDERVLSLCREINRNHHEDEVRHLAFGRVMLKELFDQYAPRWSAETLQGVRDYIRSYYLSTWREYYNPDIYADAGLANAYEIAESVFESQTAKAHRNKTSKASLLYLCKIGVLSEGFDL